MQELRKEVTWQASATQCRHGIKSANTKRKGFLINQSYAGGESSTGTELICIKDTICCIFWVVYLNVSNSFFKPSEVSNFIQGNRVFVQRVRKLANMTKQDVNKTFSHFCLSLFRDNGTLLWQTNIQGFSLNGFAEKKTSSVKKFHVMKILTITTLTFKGCLKNLDSIPFCVLL